MNKLLLTTLVACLWASASSAQTTIGFDSVESRTSIEGYTEGGIAFGDESNFAATIGPDTGGIPSNGTPFLSSCGICLPSLEAEEGGCRRSHGGVDVGCPVDSLCQPPRFLFEILHVEILAVVLGITKAYTTRVGSGPFPIQVTITGLRNDGSIAALAVTTDGIVGFEAFELDEQFTDLVSAQFSTASPFLAIAIDDIRVRVGLDKPALTISPASGLYVTTQAFDLTLIVAGASLGTILNGTLDGADFTAELAACAVEGQLDSVPGVTFRCPIDLDGGVHTFSASVESSDGTTTDDSVTWELLPNSEP